MTREELIAFLEKWLDHVYRSGNQHIAEALLASLSDMEDWDG